VYPSSGGLRKETIRLTFEGNRYDGEDQIRATLLSVRKFSDDTSNLGTWISKIEERLFDSQNPVRWKDVKDRAASKPQWQLHLPRLLDDVKAYAVKTGVWRDEGDYVRKGPFPMEPRLKPMRSKSPSSAETRTIPCARLCRIPGPIRSRSRAVCTSREANAFLSSLLDRKHLFSIPPMAQIHEPTVRRTPAHSPFLQDAA